MSAGGFVDACGFVPVSGGTGDFVVSAAITGYQTPASAGAANGTVYSYRAESADKSQWEIGFGAYTTSTTTLARTTVAASSTGVKVSFSSPPNVYITALTADLQNASLLTSGTLPVARINGGTANQFVQGDGTFQTQGRKLLNTLTASSSASLSDTTSITNAFDNYEIVFDQLIPATGSVTLEFQVHSGGAFKTTGYLSTGFTATGTSIVSASTTAFIGLCNAGSQGNTAPGVSGVLRLFNPSAAAISQMTGLFTYTPSGGTNSFPWTVTGYWNSAAAIDGFQVLASSGLLASGKIGVYGLS